MPGKPIRSFLMLMVCSFFLISCASYKAAQISPLAFDLKAQQEKVEREGIVLMANPIHSQADQQRYFDNDLLAEGVLPIQVHVGNINHPNPVILAPEEFFLKKSTGDACTPYSCSQAFDKAKKSFMRTAGWGVAFGLIGAIPSAINVSNTNKKMQADFEARSLKGGSIIKGATTEGLIFFEVPPDINSLDGWKLSLLVKDPTTSQDINLDYDLRGAVMPRPKKQDVNSDKAQNEK